MVDIPYYGNLQFDLFDAIGLPPITEDRVPATLTAENVKTVWRRVSLHLQPD